MATVENGGAPPSSIALDEPTEVVHSIRNDISSDQQPKVATTIDSSAETDDRETAIVQQMTDSIDTNMKEGAAAEADQNIAQEIAAAISSEGAVINSNSSPNETTAAASSSAPAGTIKLWPDPHLENFNDHDWPDLDSDDTSVLNWIAQHKKILIRTVTWNMCGKPPPPRDALLQKLLIRDKFHVLIVGTEECERSIAQSAINPSKKNWEKYLVDAIGPNYVPIRAHTLQAIHIMAFVHKRIAHLCSAVKSAAVPTGVGKTLGNKGGVCISFKVGSANLCFVNAHLSAHQKAENRRNAEFHRIMQRIPALLLEKKEAALSPRGGRKASSRGFVASRREQVRSVNADTETAPAAVVATPVGSTLSAISPVASAATTEQASPQLVAAATADAEKEKSDGTASHTSPVATVKSSEAAVAISNQQLKLPSIVPPHQLEDINQQTSAATANSTTAMPINDSKVKLPAIELKLNRVAASIEEGMEPSSKATTTKTSSHIAITGNGESSDTATAVATSTTPRRPQEQEQQLEQRPQQTGTSPGNEIVISDAVNSSTPVVEDISSNNNNINNNNSSSNRNSSNNNNDNDNDGDNTYDDENEPFSDLENGLNQDSPRPSHLSSGDSTEIGTELQRFNSIGADAQNNGISTLNQIADVTVFMGDLNYRINGNRSIVAKLVEQNMHEVLLCNDQLRANMKKKLVFNNFVEPPLNFKPTYKYDVGSSHYDTSGKSRIPSWTDRILYVPSEQVTCLAYNSEDTLTSSDHRPVYASFAVQLLLPQKELDNCRGGGNYIDDGGDGNNRNSNSSSSNHGNVSSSNNGNKQLDEKVSPEFSSHSQVCTIM